jgi:hypothetical protein
MKSKAINAQLNKKSKTFDGWLKYEVTIQHSDNSTELIPAYGKDLQDALSRVVHDSKATKLHTKVKSIPELVWISLWFGYATGWTLLTYEISLSPTNEGLFFLAGILFLTIMVIFSKRWFKKRNISKTHKK